MIIIVFLFLTLSAPFSAIMIDFICFVLLIDICSSANLSRVVVDRAATASSSSSFSRRDSLFRSCCVVVFSIR